MSKYYASEMSVKVKEEEIQIFGWYGYVREYPVERGHLRDPAAGDRSRDQGMRVE